MIDTGLKSNNLMGTKASKDTKAMEILSIVSVVILVILIVIYFVISNLKDKAIQEINLVEQEIATTITEEQRWEEKELIKYKEKAQLFSELLEDRKLASKILDFLERSIMSNVKVTGLEGTMENGGIIKVFGEAPSFLVIGQQSKIFEADSSVSDVEVVTVGLNKNGKVDFELNIILNPESISFNQL